VSFAGILKAAQLVIDGLNAIAKLVRPKAKPVNPLPHLDAERQAAAARNAGHELDPTRKGKPP
jgi:hypothetical protein